MIERDPKLVALLFNECINNRDLDALVDLMTKNHTFIDSENDVIEGKEKMKEGWKEFFTSYPDYRNIFHTAISRDNLVIFLGHSECSYKPLDGPAIWTAKVENDKIAEWRIYEDSKENRKNLEIED